ncbi:hypothetical protein [Mesorhizobium sp.]|uniref:hypothetical protein n=1 Tax=Mesorhizobium sp. TaxID=1871066 RepID=UPI000FEAABDB|nr:hypothetical protein [Mesorhizobium sp.]RWO22854.1 MAG: hypothetical protein EOS09_19495 [Mesorhizobium sp.]
MSARTTATIAFGATITLNETEVRALDALVGYGDDAFLKVFKEKLGAAYIRDYEAGLRSFFRAVGRDVLPALREIEDARRDLLKAAQKRVEARATEPAERQKP